MKNLFKKLSDFIKKIFNRGSSRNKEKQDNKNIEEYEKNYFRKMPNGDMLTLPYEATELYKIFDTVRHLARDDGRKRLMYDTALSTAFQPAKDIFDLYYLVPRVWLGESVAIDEFEKLLNRGKEMYKPDVNAFMMQSKQSLNRLNTTTNIPSKDFNRPCEPFFFIKPDIIRTLHHAAYFLTGGEKEAYQRHVSTIDQMWRATSTMDSLNVAAHINERNKGAILNDMIHVIMKEHELPERIGKERDPLSAEYGLTYPPIDEPWYPQDPGLGRPPLGPDGGPGYPGMPELPRDCFPFREYCDDVVRGMTPNYNPMPDSISIGDITGISKRHACEDDIVTINGSNFGSSQAEYAVVFGTTKAEVISWSATKIRVKVPGGLSGTFCVGIRDENAEKERRNIHNNNAKQFSGINDSLRVCFGIPGRLPDVPYRPGSPECARSNRITIGKPTIARFSINESNSITVERGTELTLNWRVVNADSITIQRHNSSFGPMVNITNPHTGQQNIGAFNVNSVVTTKYRLTATNTCGTVSKIVEVTSTSSYSLGILGIEVTQAIQRFDWNNPGQNNSVKLVSRKRTMVRVYLESGMSNGFNFGAGANNLPNVTGHLKLTYPNGSSTIINNALNPGNGVAVQSKQNVDRENLDHSLNFILPVPNLHGNCTIEAEVNTSFSQNNQTENSSVDVVFRQKSKLKLVRILVNDTINGFSAPSANDFSNVLIGAKKRTPVEESGFQIYTAGGFAVINTRVRNNFWGSNRDEDLTTEDGWSYLLDRLDDIADDFNNSGEIWVGLVPDENSYEWNGLATSGEVSFWFDSHPRMLTKAGKRATFAHELAHTLGIMHAASVDASANPLVNTCGSPESSSIDSNTLKSLTEDVGMNVRDRRVMPKGIPTLMTYCTPNINGTIDYQDRWVSIDLWNRLWNQI